MEKSDLSVVEVFDILTLLLVHANQIYQGNTS
jgi:hypothetical protein